MSPVCVSPLKDCAVGLGKLNDSLLSYVWEVCPRLVAMVLKHDGKACNSSHVVGIGESSHSQDIASAPLFALVKNLEISRIGSSDDKELN